MKYLLETVKDINTSFIIKPYDPKLFILFGNNDRLLLDIDGGVYNPILPNSKEAIINSWLLYELDGFGEDFEKVKISIDEYDPKKHFAKFKFSKLEEALSIKDFKADIEESVNLSQKREIEDLKKSLLNANTDFKIKTLLLHKIENIQKSINLLTNLKLNKIQGIVKNYYLQNYQKTLIYINNEYGSYLPQIKDDGLNKLLVHSKINLFLTLETQLIDRGFIQKSGNSLYWCEDKIKMISFCRLIEYHKYTNQYITVKRLINFLEKRYNIDTGDQKKESKYSKKSIKFIEVDFFFFKF
jgi:hypothetical protein